MKYLFTFCLVLSLASYIQAQSADDLINEGVSLLEAGQAADALPKLDAAIAADASSAKAYFKRGKVKSALQDDAGALADYNKAIELGETSGELYRMKAMSEHLTGNKEQGCADFQAAIDKGDAVAEEMKARFCDG